jgi:hypothetical protein
MFKSGVKPSIRRTGAEIIDFLVFRNKSLKEVYGPIVAKNGIELNYFLLYKLWS